VVKSGGGPAKIALELLKLTVPSPTQVVASAQTRKYVEHPTGQEKQ
jgi:hypothetical protein